MLIMKWQPDRVGRLAAYWTYEPARRGPASCLQTSTPVVELKVSLGRKPASLTATS